jgi:hypothetical protein
MITLSRGNAALISVFGDAELLSEFDAAAEK